MWPYRTHQAASKHTHTRLRDTLSKLDWLLQNHHNRRRHLVLHLLLHCCSVFPFCLLVATNQLAAACLYQHHCCRHCRHRRRQHTTTSSQSSKFQTHILKKATQAESLFVCSSLTIYRRPPSARLFGHWSTHQARQCSQTLWAAGHSIERDRLSTQIGRAHV